MLAYLTSETTVMQPCTWHICSYSRATVSSPAAQAKYRETQKRKREELGDLCRQLRIQLTEKAEALARANAQKAALEAELSSLPATADGRVLAPEGCPVEDAREASPSLLPAAEVVRLSAELSTLAKAAYPFKLSALAIALGFEDFMVVLVRSCACSQEFAVVTGIVS